MSLQNSTSPFEPTRWTLVLRARGESSEARVALSELCDAYYQPVFRFLRHEGRDAEVAQELTQEFFARVLSGSGFDGADPERGRFRSYLLGALKHFLADAREREQALKRGAGTVPDSLSTDEGGQADVPDPAAPALDFDREWALTIMDRALSKVGQEMKAAGKGEQYEILKPWLVGDAPSMSQAQAARLLGINEGAVKVAVHRLRKRFREATRAEIAQTLRDPALVDEELRHLVAALGG